MTRMDAPTSSTESPSRFGRLTAVRDRVRAKPGGALAWRIGVTIVGVAVIAVGVVLLPLPGPGWLIIFAGLGILATEYERASRLLAWGRGVLKQWTDWTRRQPRWLQAVIGIVGIAFLVAIFAASWFLTH